MIINFPNTLEKTNYLMENSKLHDSYFHSIHFATIIPHTQKKKIRPFKNSSSQSCLMRPFTHLSAHTAHHPGWRWAAHEGADHSCWAPQGGGGRSPGDSTLPSSLTWWGTGDPPSCTVPRVACIPRNKAHIWGQLLERSREERSWVYIWSLISSFGRNEHFWFRMLDTPKRHQWVPQWGTNAGT